MFRMYLQPKSNLDKVINNEEKQYDDELDDETSIISDICKFFHGTNNIEFIVSGFGSELWPVAYSKQVCPELLNEKLFRDWLYLYNLSHVLNCSIPTIKPR